MTEEELLAKYRSAWDRDEKCYDKTNMPQEGWVMLCKLKDKSNATLDKRCKAAWEAIDLIARCVGLDPDGFGYALYVPDCEGGSPIVSKIEELLSQRGGET